MIDLYNWQERCERALARFLEDPRFSQANKTLIKKFLRDAQLGKTNLTRARKKVGCARRYCMLNELTTLMLHVRKDLNTLTQEDMEGFIEDLETGRIR